MVSTEKSDRLSLFLGISAVIGETVKNDRKCRERERGDDMQEMV